MKIFHCLALATLLPNFTCGQDVPLDVKQSSLKFTGHAFLHDFNGEAKEFTGSAKIDAQKPELVTSAKIDIAAAKMTTFESGRDTNMYAWLHVDTIPGISFELTHVLSMDGRSAVGTKDHPAKFVVSGNFTLNKVAKPLETQALGWREGKWLVVTGTTQVDTADHGLPIIQQYFMTVDKDVDIDFRLVFDLPPNLQVAAKP
jgi:polyisoprenoid-binding protein YceI